MPLRLDYLFNVIYLRDAWMHGFDLARATEMQRFATDKDAVVMAQIVWDAATAWGAGSAVELELTGEQSGEWQLGQGVPEARLRTDGLELCRSLSGRIPTTGISTVSGNPQLAHTLGGLRVLF